MLVQAGLPANRAVAGLTATSPADLRGRSSPCRCWPCRRSCAAASAATCSRPALIGLVVLVALFAVGSVLIAFDGPLAWVGRVVQRVRNRLRRGAEPLQRLPAAPAARARPHLGDPRPALEARPRGHRRPLGVRLRDAARRARRDRLGGAPGARAARLLRRADPRADPHHAGRPRLRRGGPHGDAHARRRARRQRRARHLRLSAVLVLAALCPSGSPPTAGTRAGRPPDAPPRRRRRRRDAQSGRSSRTQRKPTWLMPVSTICGRRAAGR